MTVTAFFQNTETKTGERGKKTLRKPNVQALSED